MAADAADVRRRPRRTRFTGRRAPGGSGLDSTPEPTPQRTSGDPVWILPAMYPPPAPKKQQDERDPDERVDDLELGGGTTTFGSILGERMAPALEFPKRTMSFLLTSPGRLTLAAVVLIIAILAAGLSMSQSTSNRQQQLATVSSASEPQANAAQNLYSALTIADASANTSFSRGGLGSAPQLRQRYDDAIAQATLAGTRAAAGITEVDGESMRNIATVQRLIPVYTGLVESARANARQGHPVGVAYLAEASGLMRSEILPAAAALYEDTSRSVAEDRAKLTGLPWVPLSGLLAAVLMLLFVQWRLTRRTGRLFNTGLTAATALMVVALLAVSLATTLSWRGTASFGGSYSPVQTLTEARITAQQARASETLALVRRQPGEVAAFDTDAEKIRALIDDSGEAGDAAGQAGDALQEWRRGHAEMRARLDSGDYQGAVEAATVEGARPHSSADAFGRLDSALQTAIAEARLDLRAEIEDARQASAALSALVVLLSIAATICVVVGFRHRLLEYL
ncbi:hypothetical protein [Corynebacterium xerosis]|uniref:hypothetical protein n=1 Tax=Corynebacterium xerosis TaxID=1725 RepID=UPI0013CECB72|nr:hypothetical protein [Corynebacterium xerosis]